MIQRNKLWHTFKDYLFITIGMGMYAFGFTAFILPQEVVMGGLAGVSTVVYLLTGLPVAVTQYAINLILLAIAYKVVGRKFVLGTIFGVTIASVWLGILQPIFVHGLIKGDLFMNIVIGGIICGIGVGLTFVHNGSSGGTDILAAMVNKHKDVSIGRMMIYCDLFIISSGYFITHDPTKVVCGFIILVLVSTMADMVINSNRQAVQFTIISKRWQEIATAVNNDANRGCTVIEGTGWYSKQPVKMLIVMCRKSESVTIFRICKSIDPNAMVTQVNCNGVYGEGFDQIKVKMKLKPTGTNEQDIHSRIDAATRSDYGGHPASRI